jgi:hypothetical protein
MSESYADQDLATLRAIARSAGLTDADQMSHDELVDALRRAGLAEPSGQPIDAQMSDHGDRDPSLYHGEGVGRREETGREETGDARAQGGGTSPGTA